MLSRCKAIGQLSFITPLGLELLVILAGWAIAGKV